MEPVASAFPDSRPARAGASPGEWGRSGLRPGKDAFVMIAIG